MFDREDVEAAWVYCSGLQVSAPLELLRVIESDEAPECGANLDDKCVPMDGAWLTFSGETGLWHEERGGSFWGYDNVYEYAEDVFRFDPVSGRKYLGGGGGREFWPIAASDVEALEEMGDSWQESLARCLAAVPRWRRRDGLLRVPELMRVDFGRWCCLVEDSGTLERGPIVGTREFREVVRECACQTRLIPWAREARYATRT